MKFFYGLQTLGGPRYFDFFAYQPFGFPLVNKAGYETLISEKGVG